MPGAYFIKGRASLYTDIYRWYTKEWPFHHGSSPTETALALYALQ